MDPSSKLLGKSTEAYDGDVDVITAAKAPTLKEMILLNIRGCRTKELDHCRPVHAQRQAMPHRTENSPRAMVSSCGGRVRTLVEKKGRREI